MVTWTIECDELNVSQKVQTYSNAQMVRELLDRGFQRILKSHLPYQDEPLGYIDSKGREWDAMPALAITKVETIPHMDVISANK